MKGIITIVLIACLGGLNGLQAQVKKADKNFERLLYAAAAKHYEKCVAKSPLDWHCVNRLADCYRLLNQSENAEKWYARAAKNRNASPEVFYHYGMALMNNRKWEAAEPQFERYLDLNPSDPRGKHMLDASRDYAQFMVDSSLYDVKITNINSPEADFSPNIYQGELIFASARNSSRFQFGWSKTFFLQLFQAPYYGKPDLGRPDVMRSRTNSKLHEAHVTFSPDGETMVFSRNNIYKGKVGKDAGNTIRLKTFTATMQQGKWKKIEDIPYNSDEYSVGHPALSGDGKRLYFVSDMPGGFGGTDLYVAEVDLENGNWGSPRNLGPEVNTPGNEMFPWMSQEGDLYFASNGWKGMGGLDLFLVKGFEQGGEERKNMGYPINSSKDDFAMVIDPKNGLGFFSSNRPNGVGDDDIYSVRGRIAIEGTVVNAKTGEVIPDARVEVFNVRALQGLSRTDAAGEFTQGATPELDYYAVASKEGYTEGRVKFHTRGLSWRDVVEVELELEPVDCDEKVVFQGTLVDESGNPLAGRKVKVVEKAMVVETDANGQVLTDLSPEGDYEFVYEGPDATVPVVTPIDMSDLVSRDTVRGKLTLAQPKVGDVFYIIYYNYDKYDIRKSDARPELDRLVSFMKANPEVKVLLTSHTDSRASHAYNVTLSKNRALEAFSYLASHGVAESRMKYRWKGESELTNGCKNGVKCSEADHQLNRRTEFTLLAN